MFEKIKIAQAQDNGFEAVNNLEASDQKMVELNNSLLNTLNEYQELNFSQQSKPFFSFDNIYFWGLLVGLILLAFALGALLRELKKSPATPRQSKRTEDNLPNIAKEESGPKTKEADEAPRASKKIIKIKVVKVKK